MDIINDHEIQPISLSISHHYMINVFTQYKAPLQPEKNPSHPRLSPLDYHNFHSKDTNWNNIRASLGQTNWEEILNNKSTRDILEIIYNKTLETTKENVPLRNETKKITKQKRIRMNLARKQTIPKSNISNEKRTSL